MTILTRDNARQLLADVSKLILKAGERGILLADLDAVEAYLAGILSVEGRVAVVMREGQTFIVWLERRAANPPVFIEE